MILASLPRSLAPLPLLILAAVAASPSAPRNAADRVRLELLATTWSSWGNSRETDTLLVEVASGEDIVDGRHGGGWPPFAPGAPFRRGAREGPDRVWVMPSSHVRSEYLDRIAPDRKGDDSVLVSTAWRSFRTPSFDSGVTFMLRVIPSRPPHRRGEDAALGITRRGRGAIGERGLEKEVLQAEVVGVFRLLGLAPADDVHGAGSRALPWTELRFRIEQVWKGDALHPGDEVMVRVPGERDGTMWRPMRESMPIRKGAPAVLFLMRRRDASRTWTFNSYGGYATFGDSEDLIFSEFGRGGGIGDFRRAVERAAQPATNRYHAPVLGRVLHGANGDAAQDLRVSVGPDSLGDTTDAAGWFEIPGVPIGLTLLRVSGPCGSAAGVIEVNDEFADTLEVRMPFSAPPCEAIPIESAPPRDASPR